MNYNYLIVGLVFLAGAATIWFVPALSTIKIKRSSVVSGILVSQAAVTLILMAIGAILIFLGLGVLKT